MVTEVSLAKDTEAKLWDEIVENSPHGTIFHTWRWLKITEKYTKFQFYPLLIRTGDEVRGIFPIFHRSHLFISMIFSPPPHAAIPCLGPVIVDYEKQRLYKKELILTELQGAIDEYLHRQLKSNYVSIAFSPGLNDPRPFGWAGYRVSSAYDYETDLSCGSEIMWEQLPKNLRQNVNRAVKRGLSVEIGTERDVDALYEIMVRRYKEQDKFVHVPKEYLLDLYRSFDGSMRIFVAKFEGNVISGSIELFHKDKVTSWIGTPKPLINISPSPNDLISWEIIKYSIERKFRSYTTFGAAGDERLHAYYASKFNPELKMRYIVKKISFIARIAEKGFYHILNPVSDRIRR
jgi:hypothetical protein